ncbi:hypothetical protein, partial [Actinomadura chokoriensis]|uniref:hypothetical protein n=1 Tax=Actinomadura chokoriensis TaxID=454156 RepID=UPI0031F9104A
MPIYTTFEKRLIDQRLKIWEEAKRMADRIEGEKRDFSAEEDRIWARLNADIDAIDERLKAETARQQRDRASMETFEQIRGQPVEGRMASAENAMLADEFRNRIRTRSREPIEISFADARS